jgi:hypothetical protein
MSFGVGRAQVDTYQTSAVSLRFAHPETEEAFLQHRLDSMIKAISTCCFGMGIMGIMAALNDSHDVAVRLSVGTFGLSLGALLRTAFFRRFADKYFGFRACEGLVMVLYLSLLGIGLFFDTGSDADRCSNLVSEIGMAIFYDAMSPLST